MIRAITRPEEPEVTTLEIFENLKKKYRCAIENLCDCCVQFVRAFQEMLAPTKICWSRERGSDRNGFLMIELLMVFAIITILTSLSLSSLSGFKEGQAPVVSREEAAVLIERARSLAIYSGDEMKLKFDSTNRTFWVEDTTGKKKTDVEKLEQGVIISGPPEVVFKGTGALATGAVVSYSFQGERSGKLFNLKIYPKTGRVEKGG